MGREARLVLPLNTQDVHNVSNIFFVFQAEQLTEEQIAGEWRNVENLYSAFSNLKIENCAVLLINPLDICLGKDNTIQVLAVYCQLKAKFKEQPRKHLVTSCFLENGYPHLSNWFFINYISANKTKLIYHPIWPISDYDLIVTSFNQFIMKTIFRYNILNYLFSNTA